MTCALVTLLAPSVKATAPAALSRPISAISSPRRPLVSAAMGCTCTIEVSRARRSTKSTIAGSSIAGEVSGWDTMVVTPPAAAAGLADESAHVDEAGRDQLALAVDDLGRLRHAGGADAALGLADHAIGDEKVAVDVEMARGVEDARVGEQDRATLGDHHHGAPSSPAKTTTSGIRQVPR